MIIWYNRYRNTPAVLDIPRGVITNQKGIDYVVNYNTLKTCSKCEEEKPLTNEYFRENKESNTFRGACRSCDKEYSRRYRKENKEKVRACNRRHREENIEHYRERSKKYYLENKDRISEYRQEYSKRYREENKERLQKYRDDKREYYKEYNKEYYKNNKEYHRNYVEENKDHRKKYFEANKERIMNYQKEYYEENKAEMQAQRKEYYERNKKRILERNSKYRKSNRHILNRAQQRRRAVKRKLQHTLTIEQWNDIKVHFNNSCSYCGMEEEKHVKVFKEVLHQDHFIPLDDGGEYTHNNIIPACRSCNSSKNNQNFFEWYPTHKHYSEKREKILLKFLGYKDNIQQLSIL